MSKKILVDAAYKGDVRAVLLNKNGEIQSFEYETISKKQIKGNIYLAKVTRIEPSLQAAFIDYGSEKSGFLPFSEIHPDYYQIPVSDREKLKQEIGGGMTEMLPPEITKEDIAEQERLSSINSDEDDFDITKYESFETDFEDHSESHNINEDYEDHDKDSEVPIYKRYKIQEVIKNGQILLVQVQKEERGNKGAAFTSFVSLAGKYCVLMINRKGKNGVSKRIVRHEERRRLKSIVDKLCTKGNEQLSSVIIRTAGTGKTTYELKRDYDYLVRLWNKIREVTMTSTAPEFIHSEDSMIQKVIRDMFDHSVSEILIQGNIAYKQALSFVQNVLPTEIDKVKEHKSNQPLYCLYNIEEKLSEFYKPIVQLPSGGYIVINPTEALTAIDINSGRANNERNIEKTALKNNLEAAKEIARHMRLRDISGLVVIDFIDMIEHRNRKIVERTFRDLILRDKARVQVGGISSFGLMELSRQRLRSSFLESNSDICNHCSGKGIVRSAESNAMVILRTIENEINLDKCSIINVQAHTNSVLKLLNYKKSEILAIEKKYNIKINFYCDEKANADIFSIEKIKNEESKNIEASIIDPKLNSADLYVKPRDNNKELVIEEDDTKNSVKTSKKKPVKTAQSKKKAPVKRALKDKK